MVPRYGVVMAAWALMVFVGFGLRLPRCGTLLLVALAIGFSTPVEFSQPYHALRNEEARSAVCRPPRARVEEIRDTLGQAAILPADGTGVRCIGKTHWLHVVSTAITLLNSYKSSRIKFQQTRDRDPIRCHGAFICAHAAQGFPSTLPSG